VSKNAHPANHVKLLESITGVMSIAYRNVMIRSRESSSEISLIDSICQIRGVMFTQLKAQFESLFPSASGSSDQSDIKPLRVLRRIMLPHRSEAHPSRRSPMSRHMGSTNRKCGDSLSRQPKQGNVYRCRICTQLEHNATRWKANVNHKSLI
jgi:hypothetical protein